MSESTSSSSFLWDSNLRFFGNFQTKMGFVLLAIGTFATKLTNSNLNRDGRAQKGPKFNRDLRSWHSSLYT